MIYFVRLASNSIKIGHTENLSQRLIDLRATYGDPVHVIFTEPGNHQREKILHRLFDDSRFIGTEQFRPSQDIMEFIGQSSPSNIDPKCVKVTPQKSKVMRSFRFRKSTDQLVNDLSTKFGINRTTAIEIAIRTLAKSKDSPIQLSSTARCLIAKLDKKLGITQTGVMEMAVRRLAETEKVK